MSLLEEMAAHLTKEIEQSGHMTEEQMRNADAPWPDSLEELTDYIQSLTERPHDYGTTVYAMSLAAVAALRYVGSKLGASGYQASVADLDVLRRTRSWSWGRILDYENLLYPYNLNDEEFPSIDSLLLTESKELSKRARELLRSSNSIAHPDDIEHWKRLSIRRLPAEEIEDAYRSVGYLPANRLGVDERKKRCCPISAIAMHEGADPKILLEDRSRNRFLESIGFNTEYTDGFIEGFNGILPRSPKESSSQLQASDLRDLGRSDGSLAAKALQKKGWLS